MSNYREEVLFAEQTAKEAWQFACANNSGIMAGHPSSEQLADIEMGLARFIKSRLKQRYPMDAQLSDGLMGEGAGGRCWVIDPLSGTTNFARGGRGFGIQISLCVRAVPVVSVIWLPLQLECFSAAAGEGAFRNGRPLKVAKESHTPLLVAMADFPQEAGLRLRQQQHMCAMTDLGTGIRIQGAVCLDMTALACGSVDAVVYHSARFWDVMSGVFLLREAGGVALDLDGAPWQVSSSSLVASRSQEIAQLALADARPKAPRQ